MFASYLKQALRRHRLNRADVLDATDQPIVQFGGWHTVPSAVNSRLPVYSFGVGDKIGWDLAMIRQFGVTVHAFDPTPGSIAWVAGQQLPPKFVFHDIGISDFDGELEFHPPPNAGNTHYSQEPLRAGRRTRPPVRGQVRRLATIMQDLGHTRLGVLKLDVEGSEFEAIPDVLASGIPFDQLLLEIHYHFPSRSFRKGLDLIEQLRRSGLRCVFISPRGLEFTFVRERTAHHLARAA